MRFLLVGSGGYLVNVATFSVLVHAGARYVAASAASYLLANLLMYVGNRYYTFRLGHDGLLSAYLRYVLVGLGVVALNAVLLALLVERVGIPRTIALAVSLLMLTPIAFVLFKRWTFRVRCAW